MESRLGVGNGKTLGPELCLRAGNENSLHFKVSKVGSEFQDLIRVILHKNLILPTNF